MSSIKIFHSRNKIAERDNGEIQEHLVDRKYGIPGHSETVFIDNMRCKVFSCQPAGREHLKLIVRKA